MIGGNEKFTIVNEDGEIGHSAGLLLYYGKTVCDDGFSDNSANAICRLMGYPGAISWRNGQLSEIQFYLYIGLDNVNCSSGSWESCNFTTLHDCSHIEDIHLMCEMAG